MPAAIVLPQEHHTVRAAVFSASFVSVGLFLAVAAAFAFSPTWIGLGILAIALVGAVVMVVSDAREPQPVR
ncbi:MAG: hypothetical protein KY392_00665 [Chloroflexi bacterium]|nr:hypothetical protein [Chloroflexota bacterium]